MAHTKDSTSGAGPGPLQDPSAEQTYGNVMKSPSGLTSGFEDEVGSTRRIVRRATAPTPVRISGGSP